MRLELTGRHIDITDGVRRIINGKLARLERRLNDSAVSAQVVLTREKVGSRVDVTLHARGEKFLHGAGRGDSVASAMTVAVDKLAQQATKVKGKWLTRKRQGTKTGAVLAPATEPADRGAATPARRPRMRAPRALRVIRQEITILSVGHAAASVDDETGLVIFKDAETGRIAVVYRAPSGDLTLVETE